MLVQCPECNTKYNLNENQIAPEGSKVRCVRCKNVFTAFRSQVETKSAPPVVEDEPGGLAAERKLAALADSAPPRTAPAPEPAFAEDLEQLVIDKSIGAESAAPQVKTSTTRSIEDDLDQLLADAATEDKSRPAPASSGISFEDELDDLLAEKTGQPEAPAAAPRASSFEDELDDLFAGKKDTSRPAGKPAGSSTEASFEDDLEQFFVERKSEAPVNPAAASRPSRDAALDEADDFFVEKKKSASARASSKDDMVADLEGAFQRPLIDKTPRDELLAEDEPRSKVVKKSGRFGLIVTILVLLIMATGAGIYFKFIWLPARDAARNSTVVDAGGEPPAASTSVAQIALENVRQYFVPNEKEGQLFIIEGKAVNRFPEPKELLRLKASLYDKQGKVVTAQEFMCGNVVTLYQLQVSSRQDIEAALGAKVGILAHNTNLQSGASAPFMVVFFGAPETVEEFGLEVVQSQSPQ